MKGLAHLALTSVVALLCSNVVAFPRMNAGGIEKLLDRAQIATEEKCPFGGKTKAKRQVTFDPTAQKVSTTGANAFVPPGTGDQRGPCPGLNALANHNYLPHNGVADIPTIVNAVNTGMSRLSHRQVIRKN